MGKDINLSLGSLSNYPVHSRPCERCGDPIKLTSESVPSDDNKFKCTKYIYKLQKIIDDIYNNFRCAEYTREELKHKECDESPEKERTKSIAKVL